MNNIIHFLCSYVFPKLLVSMGWYVAFVAAVCAADAAVPSLKGRFGTPLSKSLPLLLILAMVWAAS